MQINDERINKLIGDFGKSLTEKGLHFTLEYLDWPWNVVWITEKQPRAIDNCDAYIRKIEAHGYTAGQSDIPLFRIVLIKERVLELSDGEFLHLLAHECSHILLMVKNHPDQELACDVLAEHFFGFPKPEGSTLGYLYDDIAFEKVYGRKPMMIRIEKPICVECGQICDCKHIRMAHLCSLCEDHELAIAMKERWKGLAEAWTPQSDYTLQSLAPADVECTTCWDTRLCCECLGRYPDICPECNGQDRCMDCAT